LFIQTVPLEFCSRRSLSTLPNRG